MNNFKTKELGRILAAANDGRVGFEYAHTSLTHGKNLSEATKILVLDLFKGYEFVNFNVDTVVLNNGLEADDYSATISLTYDDHGYRWNKDEELTFLKLVSENLKYHHIKIEEDKI